MMEIIHFSRIVCLLFFAIIKSTKSFPLFLSSKVFGHNNRFLTPRTEPFHFDLEDVSLSPDTSLDWSFVDYAYLITCPNADFNSERLTKAKSILNEVGLIDRVKIMEFDTDDEDRIRGCYTSHISVLKCAKEDIQRSQSDESDSNWWRPVLSFLDNEKRTFDNVNRRKSKVLVLEDNIACNGFLEKEKEGKGKRIEG